MQTRILGVVAIVGLILAWFASTQNEKNLVVLGIVIFIIGFIGAYLSARNKKGMGFLRKL